MCQSELSGTYAAHTEWFAIPANVEVAGTSDYTVDLTSSGGAVGQYVLPDLSGGMEADYYQNEPVKSVIEDLCGTIKLISAPYGYKYSIAEGSTIDPATGVFTINWENYYGEHGTTTLTPQ